MNKNTVANKDGTKVRNFMKKRFISTLEAAEYLATTRGVLANLRLKGEGPSYVKLRRRVLYDLHDLEAWLESHKVFTCKVSN